MQSALAAILMLAFLGWLLLYLVGDGWSPKLTVGGAVDRRYHSRLLSCAVAAGDLVGAVTPDNFLWLVVVAVLVLLIRIEIGAVLLAGGAAARNLVELANYDIGFLSMVQMALIGSFLGVGLMAAAIRLILGKTGTRSNTADLVLAAFVAFRLLAMVLAPAGLSLLEGDLDTPLLVSIGALVVVLTLGFGFAPAFMASIGGPALLAVDLYFAASGACIGPHGPCLGPDGITVTILVAILFLVAKNLRPSFGSGR